MGVFARARGFERIVYAQDAKAGLRAIIAIHSTRLGPALGGCRIQPYRTEESALDDVTRLAESMTWKAAAAGLDLGGGKAVIIADPERDRDEALLRAFGRAVESLNGRYITSVDVGSGVDDMDEIRRETKWVVGVSPAYNGSGDPSPITAEGVAVSMRACAHHVWREASLKGRRIGIQGVGKVGYHLAGILTREGAEVVVADPSVDNLGRVVADFGVETVPPDQILELECDLLAPCALGGVITAEVIPRLKCKIVCGSANNQLTDISDADTLSDASILYAPDFIVNAGGLISVADELIGWHRERVLQRVSKVGRTLLDVFHISQVRNVSTAQAAVEYAKQRMRTISALNR